MSTNQSWKLLLPFVLACASGAATAQDFDSGWIIGKRQDFLDYEFNAGQLRINNCQVSEKSQPMYNGAWQIKLSCSARNLSPTTALFSIQVIGMPDEGGFAFALSAEPSFGRVTGGKTETITSSNITFEGAAEAASDYVFRIVGKFAE